MLFKNKFSFLFWAALFIAGCQSDKQPTVSLDGLTVNMAEHPLGVDSEDLRLGWKISSEGHNVSQDAYQILMAKTAEGLKDSTLVWNSGKVTSGESQHITYGGEELLSGQEYFWKVRIWNNDREEASPWSETAYFYTSPSPKDLNAQWIGAIRREGSGLPEGRKFHTPTFPKEKRQEIIAAADSLAYRSIMLRKDFEIESRVEEAKLFISGLGHYELSLNGQRIGNREFAPFWSDYDKTVYYNIYDVKEKLNEGKNAIGVLLGNGMYNVIGGRYSKFFVSFGPPTLFLQLEILYADGSKETIRSGKDWKYDKSPITYNSIFGGEDYNANLEQNGWDAPGFDQSHWKDVVVQNPPKGKLRPQTAPPVKVEKLYHVQEINEPQPGLYVFDMGQNLSGFPNIKVKGEKGQKVRIWVGEALEEDGTIDQGGSGGPHYYEYTLKGDGVEQWQPNFSYYGFQYIQMEDINLEGDKNKNFPTLLEVTSKFIHNSAERAGSFESSNEIFNRTHELINNAILSNFHSVFTDCPHREKLAWLEETHLNGPGLFYNYHLETFIPKVMQDIADAQRENGLIPNTAPEYVIFGGDFTDSPEWGVAGVVLPWMYYEFYGDPSIIEEYYDVMKAYVDYLSSTAVNNIVSHGLGDWYDYGEHPAGYSKNSPIALSATSHYYYGAKLVAKAAVLLSKEKDIARYEKLTAEIKAAYNEEFFDAETKQYGTGSQYSNAVSLFMGLVAPEERDAVMENLLVDIEQRGYRLTTGDVGNRYLFQTLARNDKNEVMFKMHNHYDTPGYGFQIKFGLTTLTEQWDPRNGNSLNHFMMGQIEEWFYRSLAGIVPDKEHPGFKHFFLQPRIVGDMTYAKATHESIYGRILSNWKKRDGKLIMQVEIPANTSATVKLPLGSGSDIKINGEDIDENEFVIEYSSNGDMLTFKVGSGSYEIIGNL